MKKLLVSGILAAASFTVNADNVKIIVQSDYTGKPRSSQPAEINYAFTPASKVKFRVAGFSCTWNSSSTPFGSGGGSGCNYSITVTPFGLLSNPTSNADGCTPADEMVAACR